MPLHYWLDVEYNYALMYSFAPALHALRTWNMSQEPAPQMADSDIRQYSQFAHRAKQASRDLLSIIVHSLEPLKLLELAPVRFWSYIIAASLHLLKVWQVECTLPSMLLTCSQATLALEFSTGGFEKNTELLHSVVEATRKGSPDDIHLAIRFSNHLAALLKVTLGTRCDHTEVFPAGAPESQERNPIGEDNFNLLEHIQGLDDFNFGVLDYQGTFDPGTHDLSWWEH